MQPGRQVARCTRAAPCPTRAARGLHLGRLWSSPPPHLPRSCTRSAQVLVTCARNQAVDAVVGKLARVEGSLLVFGREEQLGVTAKRFTLKARLARHPNALHWLDAPGNCRPCRSSCDSSSSPPAGQLQRWRRAWLRHCRHPASPSRSGAGCRWSTWRPCACSSGRRTRWDTWRQDGRQAKRRCSLCCSGHRPGVQQGKGGVDSSALKPAISCLLVGLLPAAMARAERQILAHTRWVRCSGCRNPCPAGLPALHGVCCARPPRKRVPRAGCLHAP